MVTCYWINYKGKPPHRRDYKNYKVSKWIRLSQWLRILLHSSEFVHCSQIFGYFIYQGLLTCLYPETGKFFILIPHTTLALEKIWSFFPSPLAWSLPPGREDHWSIFWTRYIVTNIHCDILLQVLWGESIVGKFTILTVGGFFGSMTAYLTPQLYILPCSGTLGHSEVPRSTLPADLVWKMRQTSKTFLYSLHPSIIKWRVSPRKLQLPWSNEREDGSRYVLLVCTSRSHIGNRCSRLNNTMSS